MYFAYRASSPPGNFTSSITELKSVTTRVSWLAIVSAMSRNDP
jgi:hypothetical protein